MRVDGERIVGNVRFDRRHEGSPGFAHGGAVATVLDDALGTVLVLVRRPGVTANLTIDFRAPAFLERDLVLEAWCEHLDGRKIRLAGVLRDGEQTIAEAKALFIEVPLDHFRSSGSELPERWAAWGA